MCSYAEWMCIADAEMLLQEKYSQSVQKQQHCLDLWNKEVLSLPFKNLKKLQILSKSSCNLQGEA